MEAVDQLNKLRAYPMEPAEIVQWALTIEAVVPGIDPLALCWLVDEMLAGRHEYDRNAGIQNLTAGVRKVEKVGSGYQFKTDFPG
jgi:hypothetical protein